MNINVSRDIKCDDNPIHAVFHVNITVTCHKRSPCVKLTWRLPMIPNWVDEIDGTDRLSIIEYSKLAVMGQQFLLLVFIIEQYPKACNRKKF